MASDSPISPPRTPSHSDISFTSAHTLSAEGKESTRTTIPAHPSTSTISRDSHSSTDDRLSLTKTPSLGTPLLESTSATRLPKARVFLHREHRPDRPKILSSQSGRLPHRPATPLNLAKRGGAPSPRDKRCVSDLHDVLRANQSRVQRTPTPAPEAWLRRRGKTHPYEAPLENDENLPTWMPTDEADNWLPGPEHDPFVVENEQNSKWASSMRQLSNFCRTRTKDKSPPCIRGSILEVQPPTIIERFGLGVRGAERRHMPRAMPIRNEERSRKNKRAKGKHDELRRRARSTHACPRDDDDVVEIGRDDYVGFLIEAPEERTSRPRRSWLRFLRRKRA